MMFALVGLLAALTLVIGRYSRGTHSTVVGHDIGSASNRPEHAERLGPTRSDPARELDRRSPAREPVPREREDIGAPGVSTSRPNSVVTGHVVDDIGNPVVAFTIDFVRAPPGGVPASQVDGLDKQRADGGGSLYVEDRDGAFRLTSLEAGVWQLTATRNGQRSAPALVTLPSAPGDTRLVLPRLGSVWGTVIDTGDCPVAAAAIYVLYAGEREGPRGIQIERSPSALSDASGSFRLKDIMPGSIRISARHADYAEGVWTNVDVTPDTVARIDLWLSPGGAIQGIVDRSLGDVDARRINLYSHNGTFGWRSTRSDANGHFEMARVFPQSYILELVSTEEGSGGDRPVLRKEVQVNEGQTTQVVFADNGSQMAVEGAVVAGALPASGLTVKVFGASGDDRGAMTTTDADGRFAFVLDGPGEYVFRVASSRGAYIDFRRTVALDGKVATLEVPTGAISGRVLVDGSRPLSRLPITMVQESNMVFAGVFDYSYRQVYTDADGTFAFGLIAPGSYTIRVPDGFQTAFPQRQYDLGRSAITGIRVDNGEVSGIALHLSAGGRIAGVVVGADGLPRTAVDIVVKDLDGVVLSAIWETQADANGCFEIQSLAPGTYVIEGWSKGASGVSDYVRVEVGKTAKCAVQMR